MWDFSVLRAVGLVLRTWPFTVLRLIVWGTVTGAIVASMGVGAGLGWGVGHVGDADFRHAATFWGGLAGLGAASITIWGLREYLLYLTTAGHVAALATASAGRPMPSGVDQVRFALAETRARFGEIHLLFVLDQAVKGAVGAVTGLVSGIAAFTGAPGLDGLARLVGAVVRMSTTFVDELVLARDIRLGSDDPWTTARQSVVLYAQNATVVLKNAVWLTLFRWLAAVVIFFLVMGPAAALVWFAPGSGPGWTFLAALILTVGLQKSLIDPFCIACLMEVWERRIEGQTPDPAWDARLAEVSEAFRGIVARARSAFA